MREVDIHDTWRIKVARVVARWAIPWTVGGYGVFFALWWILEGSELLRGSLCHLVLITFVIAEGPVPFAEMWTAAMLKADDADRWRV